MARCSKDRTQRDKPVTTGTADRPPRPLLRPVVVDLAAATTELTSEPRWSTADRNSRTVATTDRMRIVLTMLRAGAAMGSDELDDTLAVQVLDGELHVRIDGAEAPLRRGQVATVEAPRAWEVVASTDALVLLTSALGPGHDSHREEGGPASAG